MVQIYVVHFNYFSTENVRLKHGEWWSDQSLLQRNRLCTISFPANNNTDWYFPLGSLYTTLHLNQCCTCPALLILFQFSFFIIVSEITSFQIACPNNGTAIPVSFSIEDARSLILNRGAHRMDDRGHPWDWCVTPVHLGFLCLHSCQNEMTYTTTDITVASCHISSLSFSWQGAGMAHAPYRGRANPKLVSGCCWWDCEKGWWTCSWGWMKGIPGRWQGYWEEGRYRVDVERAPTWLGLNGDIMVSGWPYPIPVGVDGAGHGPDKCWGSGRGWCSVEIWGLWADPSCGNSVL